MSETAILPATPASYSTSVALDAAEHARLSRTWGRPPGVWSWLSSTDHKDIGRRFIVTAFVFFLLGGMLAALMRIQLSQPERQFLNPDLYNQVFTMHGTTMMFLFAMPIMEAMGIYFVPLMIGTRNVAFPRLNAFSYYIYLAGGVMLYVAFFCNAGADAGWFSYVPLAGPEFSPGKRADFWAQMITFTEVSGMLVAVNLITTAFKLRAPGMAINRVPLFVWAIVVASFMVILAMPTVSLASSCLIMDRLVSTQFFNPAEGGDPLLWQHLFWFFGHPEVYIIFIPATGMISTMLPAFTRRPVFGYTALVLALVATGFIGFGLWVHHMFATDVPRLGQGFFTAASMMIAIPSGLQIFCWIATIWASTPRIKTPMLFVLGFIATFVMGGLTGVMLAAVPVDLQVHDTYFVVAHFHYVLIGGAVFPLFGAFYYWFPKMAGRMLDERLGRWNFWLILIGFHVTFFPMHLLGLQGMPRRVYTYPTNMGWANLNLVASLGAAVLAIGVLLFLVNVVRALRRPADAPENPWGAETLEWATQSPPPAYNFANLPIVRGRSALWEAGETSVVVGLPPDERRALATTVVDARPDHKVEFPKPSIWTLWSALAVTVLFIGSIFTAWAVIWGAVPVFIALVGWFWPKKGEK